MQETLEAIFLLIWDHKWRRLTTFMGATITQSSSFLRVWARCLKNQVKNSSRDLNEMQNMSGYKGCSTFFFMKYKFSIKNSYFLHYFIWNTKFYLEFIIFAPFYLKCQILSGILNLCPISVMVKFTIYEVFSLANCISKLFK